MAFALRKTPAARNAPKKGPISSWIGKKTGRGTEELPEIDTTAGVNRALRGARSAAVRAEDAQQENPARAALSAIEASLYAIDRIRDALEQACEVALSAKSVKDVGGRALLAERYDELRLSINSVVENVDERASVLIGKSAKHLDVHLGGKTRYSVSSTRLDTSEKGLNVSPPREAFATFEEIDSALQELDNALVRTDRAAANYCRDAQYLIARMHVDTAA